MSGRLRQQKQAHDGKNTTTDDDVITMDKDILETPTVGHKHNSRPTVTHSISPKTTSGEKIDMVISEAVETNTSSKNRLFELQKHKVELQKQREKHKHKAEYNKEMELEAKFMVEVVEFWGLPP